ncbi:MAG: oxidoreductase [Candidatus Poribacteria bacterium]|nr:MAG: oxidoreductase [Candidatus Poribacteria bacterium]
MLGVGIVGAGRISGAHAHAVARHPELFLVGVAEPDEERRTRFVERFGGEGFSAYSELLEREEVRLVLVCLPHWLHAPVAIEAMEAGKHVMVEKPMAMTLEECDAMIAAAERNSVRLMVGHTQQFFAANRLAKRLLEEGTIGEVVMATETWYKPFGLAQRPSWFLDRSKGGGMWLMNGAHMLDRLLWFLGSRVVSVKGMVSNRILGLNADDSVMALLEFENGAYATVQHCGWKRPERLIGPDELIGEIVGTEGMIKTVPYQNRIWLRKENGEYQELDPGDRGGVTEELAAFVEAILTGRPEPIPNAHSREVVRLLLAVEESSRLGREVRLD